MGDFFDIDGVFSRAGNMAADAIYLSFLWCLFSLPVVTAGASTTAMFYVATRRISSREGYIIKDFLKSFKNNFVQATLVWITFCVLMALMVLNIQIAVHSDGIIGKMQPLYLFFIFELSVMGIYAFPLIARFHMRYRELFKTVFLMANKHILTTVTCALLLVALLIAVYLCPFLIFIGVGAYSLLASFFIMRVFRMYRPDIDADSPKD